MLKAFPSKETHFPEQLKKIQNHHLSFLKISKRGSNSYLQITKLTLIQKELLFIYLIVIQMINFRYQFQIILSHLQIKRISSVQISKKNPDAMMDFDFDKDFQSTPSIPADQITSESSCSVFTFDNPDQEIINNRCSHSGKSDDNTVLINILWSKFDGFNQQESGGAVHITNCGMKSKGTTYKNCEAALGCGGAIYVKNTVHLSNNVDLDSVSFIECKAVYGGAVYIYFDSERNSANIQKCTFTRNSLISGSGSSSENGGSALFLTARQGKVDDCTFIGTGKDSMLKVTDNFDGGRNAKVLSNEGGLLTISGCNFQQERNSETSIFCENLNEDRKLVIVNCNFKGQLSNGSHYIDGKFLKKNVKNVIVNSCRFEQRTKSAINLQIVDENKKI